VFTSGMARLRLRRPTWPPTRWRLWCVWWWRGSAKKRCNRRCRHKPSVPNFLWHNREGSGFQVAMDAGPVSSGPADFFEGGREWCEGAAQKVDGRRKGGVERII